MDLLFFGFLRALAGINESSRSSDFLHQTLGQTVNRLNRF
jgi:hypothetical protein